MMLYVHKTSDDSDEASVQTLIRLTILRYSSIQTAREEITPLKCLIKRTMFRMRLENAHTEKKTGYYESECAVRGWMETSQNNH